jgi:sulfite exporter TauE/SafE
MLTLAAAFLVGLAGSVHCLGMCGGIAGALALGGPARHRVLVPLLNSGGRITSYALAGALAGGLGWILAGGAAAGHAGHGGHGDHGGHGALGMGMLFQLLTALLFIGIGLSMLTRLTPLRFIEQAGARLWRIVQPRAARLLPAGRVSGAWFAGMLWGWLPCGLVYTMLAAAATSGSPLRGAALMLAFGLGTTAAVAGAGMAAGSGRWMQQRHRLRKPAGALLLLFGLWTGWAAVAPLLSR